MSKSNPICPGNRAGIVTEPRSAWLDRRSPVLLAVFLALALGSLSWAGAVLAHEPTPPASTVNINTADAPTLAASLKGVGESRAMEIVRYREAYGPFESVDELVEVTGIGNATLEANRALITLE